ncbi:MAG: hypothetical protein ACK4GQ_03685, partial [Candidatus Hadarchaeales archaeon]
MAEEGIYGPLGFTKPILKLLRPYIKVEEEGEVYTRPVPWRVLKKVKKLVPEKNLEYRNGNAPKVSEMFGFGKEGIEYLCHVVTFERPGEKFSIYGILIPKDDRQLLKAIKEKALGSPTEVYEERGLLA